MFCRPGAFTFLLVIGIIGHAQVAAVNSSITVNSTVSSTPVVKAINTTDSTAAATSSMSTSIVGSSGKVTITSPDSTAAATSSMSTSIVGSSGKVTITSPGGTSTLALAASAEMTATTTVSTSPFSTAMSSSATETTSVDVTQSTMQVSPTSISSIAPAVVSKSVPNPVQTAAASLQQSVPSPQSTAMKVSPSKSSSVMASSSAAPNPNAGATYKGCGSNQADCKNGGKCYIGSDSSKICVCKGDYYGEKCEKEANPLLKPLVYALGGAAGFLLLVICIALLISCKKSKGYNTGSKELDDFNNIGLRAKGAVNGSYGD